MTLAPGVGRALLTFVAGLTILVLVASPAAAHEPGTSAITVTPSDSSVQIDMWLPLDRLEIALDQPLTAAGPSVVDDHGEILAAYISNHVWISSVTGGTWDPVTVEDLSLDAIDGVDHLIVVARFDAPGGVITDFTLGYDIIIEHLRTHTATVVVSSDTESSVLADTFDHANTTTDIEVDAVEVAFGRITRFGFDHVIDGLDHLLFLAVILLPAPLAVGATRQWSEPRTLRATLLRVTKIASAFTLGHTLTLAAATAGWIEAPSRLVETLIAVSIGIGAAHAIRPLHRGGDAILAVTFGLVHGMAFAAILQQLELTGTSILRTLVAFNLGVELAQLTVIALVMPSLFLLSRINWYPQIRMFGAALALVAATGWLLERAGVASNPLTVLERLTTAHLLSAASLLAVIALLGRWITTSNPTAPNPVTQPQRT